MTWVSLLFLIVPSILLLPHSLSQAESDTLKQGQQLHDWDELVSAEGVFKLGFFSPGSKTVDIGVIAPRYIGIWFNKIPFYPLWVANPNNPVPDSSGVLRMDTDGILKFAYKGGSRIAVSSNRAKANSETNIIATLLDSGNLVVRQIGADGIAGPILWQSFDYPSNMLLPEMKLGINLKTGHEWYLSSWLSEQLPSPGAFRLGLNPNGSRELMVWRRGEVYWRSGEWKNGKFELAPELTEGTFTKQLDAYQFRFVTNENERYFSYSKKSNFILSRWLLNDLGQIEQFTRDTSGWIWETTSPCTTNYTMNATGVCLNEKPSNCRNGSEFFAPRKGCMNVSFTYMNVSFTGDQIDDNAGLALSDCHAKCWTNCSCSAYSSVFDNGTGCEFWSREVQFIPDEGFGREIYLLTYDQSINGTSSYHRVP